MNWFLILNILVCVVFCVMIFNLFYLQVLILAKMQEMSHEAKAWIYL